MTDEQKKDLIRRAPNLAPDEFNELPLAARLFLETNWEELDDHDRGLYFEVWADKPGNIEHAVMSAPCTAAEIQTTAAVLRTIWDQWGRDGAFENDKKDLTARALMDAIDRRAQQCK